MDGFGGGGDLQHLLDHRDLNRQLRSSSKGGAVFDASQYAFFGNEVVEEVELGGLEDGLPAPEFEEEEEGEILGVDDLATTFSKLNKTVSVSSTGDSGDFGARKNSSVAERAQRGEFTNRFGQNVLGDGSSEESKRWSSQPHAFFPYQDESTLLYRTSSYPEQHPLQHLNQHPFDESKHLYRTSSYPEQQQQQQQQQLNHHLRFSSDPKSSLAAYPPPRDGGSLPPNAPYAASGRQMTLSSYNMSPQLQFGGNLPNFGPHGFSANNRVLGNLYNVSNDLLYQKFPHKKALTASQLLSHQHRLDHQFQSSFGRLSSMQPQSINHLVSPSHSTMNNFEVLGLKDQRTKSLPKGRQGQRYAQSGFDTSGWPQFKSKYMTPEEIENILKMQLAATHSNNPYVDDYYHLAKKATGGTLRHHFCPTHVRDSPLRACAKNETHAFLQVDALGRVCFSSICRPRPLLEVDPPKSSTGGKIDQTVLEKPLEQEPMLAARVTIEDGLFLLLDVDDIDRFVQFNQLQDGEASQLRQKRQVLLEGLASLLQLVDPLGKNGQTVDLGPKDDLVFLRIVSLPKGRKLVSRYLNLLFPGSELIRIVSMAIFRHLRFLFGSVVSDSRAMETTNKLARTISMCVAAMELRTLGACLASVVCSLEHPPLRPMGSVAGDGASVVLKSVLERATQLLTDPQAVGNCSVPNRAFWQASFNAFFLLLVKYCLGKYESFVGGSSGMEMPVELLRASLPHTNEDQRKLLMDFAQRSMDSQVTKLSVHE